MKMLLACCLVVLPLKKLQVTSSYGYRNHPVTKKNTFHAGVDLRAKQDTVYAILNGDVTKVGFDPLLGIYIKLDHGDIESLYGHLSKVFIAPGEIIPAGDPIGITGATGRVTGEHLHFCISYRHQNLDPMEFLYQILINKNHE